MSATDEVVAKAIDGLGDDLKPVETPKDKTESKSEEPAKAPEPETETPAEDPGKAHEPKEEEGLTADELTEEETEEAQKPEAKEQQMDTSGLNPEERYIVDNLPLIPVRVKSGDTIKILQVKSWTQLPEDVEFASKRDELGFINALQAQENRALSLQTQFRQQQQQKQNDEFEQRESQMIREDVAALQKEGDLPKFKVKLDDPGFDKDPATQEVQKVMDFMEERNKQYLAEYQQGRPFRHIGFREAFYMYQRQNPSQKPAEKEEDSERRQIAERNNASRGQAARDIKRPSVPRGTRIEDILNKYEAEW